MMELIREKSRTGLVFGFVMIFVILIGLTTTASNIIGDFLDLDSATMIGNTGGLMIFFGLIGLWIGFHAAGVPDGIGIRRHLQELGQQFAFLGDEVRGRRGLRRRGKRTAGQVRFPRRRSPRAPK